MGLNLSRGEPLKYYSSDRIAQLFGNGLLTFLDEKTQLNELFTNREAIFYKDINDLSEKILRYKKDNKQRKIISKKGKSKYMRYYNSNIVSQENGEADCTITTTAEVLMDLKNGDLNPMMAVMGGKIKIGGDMGLAMKVQTLLG